MNLLESLFASLARPETPLHVGEVMSLWTYAAAIDEGRSLCLLMLNHVGDQELKERIEHFVHEVEEPQRRRIYKFIREQGVTLPPITPDKGIAVPGDVPNGARLPDPEIANLFLGKIVVGLQVLSNGLIQSIRSDVGQMLYAFEVELLRESFVLKEILRKRGWMKVPPQFAASAALVDRH